MMFTTEGPLRKTNLPLQLLVGASVATLQLSRALEAPVVNSFLKQTGQNIWWL